MGSRWWKTATLVGIACAAAIAGNASWSAPPRFDGAGYAVLARALLERHSYRAIDQPDEPRHGHFPPGYPAVLAAVWKATGISIRAAHLVSVACTTLAVIASWLWFRRFMANDTALILGVALSVNWLWARTGSAILSEPLYMLLSQLAILASHQGRQRSAGWMPRTLALAVLLACCVLTRHIGVGLLLAVLLDRIVARRWGETLTIAVVTGLLVLPWAAWLAVVGSGAGTQVGMLFTGTGSWLDRIGRQLVFYFMRIPDQLTGPVVEVGTGVQASRVVRSVTGLWSAAATGIMAVGLVFGLFRPRVRLAALIPIITICILLPWPFTEAGRFLIPLVPCLLVAGLEGLSGPFVLLARRRRLKLRPSRVRRIAASVLLAASLPYSVYAMISGRARALEATQRNFDSACDWLVHHGDRPGVVLSRHPGEVFWQTGRQGLEVSTAERPAEQDAGSDAIASTIAEYHVAYLLIDRQRYTGAPRSPLELFVRARPYDVRKVWQAGEITVYEVLSPRAPR
jgi:hypothetical protein